MEKEKNLKIFIKKYYYMIYQGEYLNNNRKVKEKNTTNLFC